MLSYLSVLGQEICGEGDGGVYCICVSVYYILPQLFGAGG